MAAYQRMIAETDPTWREEALTALRDGKFVRIDAVVQELGENSGDKRKWNRNHYNNNNPNTTSNLNLNKRPETSRVFKSWPGSWLDIKSKTIELHLVLQAKDGPGSQGGQGNDVTCFGCGEKGHYKNKCPNNGSQGGGTKFEATNKILRTIRGRIKETLREITKHHTSTQGGTQITLADLTLCVEAAVKDNNVVNEGEFDDALVVRDFLEVFPEDLPGLPPTCQVEFHIELIPGAASVARAPYQLVPTEMKEIFTPAWRKKRGTPENYSRDVEERRILGNGNDAENESYSLRFRQPKIHEADNTLNDLELGAALVMTIGLDLLSRILEAQREAVKIENIEAEDISGMLKKLEARADRTLCLDNRSWLPSCYSQMPDLCQGQGWTSEALWFIGPTRYTRMEVGEDNNGFRSLSYPYGSRIRSRFCGALLHRLPKFSYNIVISRALKLHPFEDFTVGSIHSPVCWAEVRDAQLTGPEIIHETTEKIFKIRDHMQAARDRQKSYADKRRMPLEFEVGDKVMLKVAP
ncbi:putative reverse transcriptase domain-containing protein [Tanacetum coccineum]|uniref:Reverse transcriptase domain-containing protein n=1 Tax=Tanacetum coccineum TaxID=301880 RepID=A0ABQ5F7F3_9ASTR